VLDPNFAGARQVVRLRKLLRRNQGAAAAGGGGGELSIATEPEKANRRGSVIKSPHSVNWSNFVNDEGFRMESCPELADYFANQFRRFAGADEVLQWDEFWRLLKDLDLGLSDPEILQLRQRVSECQAGVYTVARTLEAPLAGPHRARSLPRFQADVNSDGIIDWNEMVNAIQPVLSKIWQAKLAKAPEYEKWVELQWDTVSPPSAVWCLAANLF